MSPDVERELQALLVDLARAAALDEWRPKADTIKQVLVVGVVIQVERPLEFAA